MGGIGEQWRDVAALGDRMPVVYLSPVCISLLGKLKSLVACGAVSRSRGIFLVVCSFHGMFRLGAPTRKPEIVDLLYLIGCWTKALERNQI